MPNLLDLMTDTDRQEMLRAAKERQRTEEQTKLGLSVRMVAKLGYYYGWEAVVAAKCGFTVKEGKKIPFSGEEMTALIDAAERIEAARCVDIAHVVQIGAASALAKSPKQVFDAGVKPFRERAK